MLRNRLYYRIKPILPRALRLRVRSWMTRRKREQTRDRWPILKGSETPPPDWPGWPEGKQFAFVLSHDVEGGKGVQKVRRLMDLEEKYGFRSSFNFIPEGNYDTPPELRAELAARGFEVGVHDLRHDGKLYSSRGAFRENAARINYYLKEWKATGFRSGFMLHNVEWLKELAVRYDASTFDTDPFEPQPDGVGTIFPFWVPRTHQVASTDSRTAQDGLVELPYTLAQDSTLFLLLRERHPDIWFQKLDWIAKHGGMAFVNVHPDYIQFEDEPESPWTFPVEIYERFLDYVSKRHSGAHWHATPGEVADYVARLRLARRRVPRRICMVSYSNYERDARVTRYAEALAERGDDVEVLALRSGPELPREEEIRGVRLVRLQKRYGKKETYRISFLLPILRFLGRASFWIARNHLRKRYDVLHIHNVPDFLVFAGFLPRLTGAKVILDIHDIVPEFYASKFGRKENSTGIRLLKYMERVSSKVAHHVIIANDLWMEKYKSRTGANGKCSVFINNVDDKVFFPRETSRKDDKLIVLFPGGLQWHQGLDIAIRAFKEVALRLPNAEFHIYGEGNQKPELVALAAQLGLQEKVRFFDPLPIREIAEVMANADLGVVPKRADSFGNEAYSTKIMEFLSLGVPVVVSETKIDRFYFDDSVVRFFQSGNTNAMADAICEMLVDVGLRRRMTARAIEYARSNSWDTRRTSYLHLVDNLSETSSPGSTTLYVEP